MYTGNKNISIKRNKQVKMQQQYCKQLIYIYRGFIKQRHSSTSAFIILF